MYETIKLMPDYGCSPVWAAGGDVGNIDLNDLPVSPSLREALGSWASRFDQTLNPEDPRNSGFRSRGDLSTFDAEGRRLWNALRRELPRTRVLYFSLLDRSLHE
jgi:hypothetical protein